LQKDIFWDIKVLLKWVHSSAGRATEPKRSLT